MNQDSNNTFSSIAISILLVFAIVKIGWVTVEKLYLPAHGVDLDNQGVKKNLYYRYRLASKAALPKIKKEIKKKVIPKAVSTMNNMHLVGVYSSGADSIVTIVKAGKSHILGISDKLDGFVLKKTTATKAYFEKGGKEYLLELFEKKSKNESTITDIEKVDTFDKNKEESKKIKVEDGVVYIPRDMLKDYTSNISKAVKDIGLRPIRKGNKMDGYKVRYVRRGTPIAKLGLLRGDIIKAINGDPITDLAGPMEMIKSADTIEGMTLTIIRRNEEKELEYEIK